MSRSDPNVCDGIGHIHNIRTLTNFDSAIIIGEQFRPCNTAEESALVFKHHLSLASTARSDKQRQDSLGYLTRRLSDDACSTAIGSHSILTKVLPLISDGSTAVRKHLLDLLRSLPPNEVAADAERVSIFIRAGLTHLSTDIANDALAVMDWLLEVAPAETVACPGGWIKTLSSFCAILGWSGTTHCGWSLAPSKSTLRAKDTSSLAGMLATLSRFLEAGLQSDSVAPGGFRNDDYAWPTSISILPLEPRPFDHINVVGAHRDEDCEMYTHREARQRVLSHRFLELIHAGVETTKKEGGILGRAASALQQSIQHGMVDFECPRVAGIDDFSVMW
jgi:pre-rRNA-processing protein IPI1